MMDSWHYEPTADYDQAPIERLKNFPRHPDLVVYTVRSLTNLIIRGLMRVWHRFEIAGRENLPAEGSFVLVANHGSHLDAPALLAALPLRKIHRAFPAAASDYFFTNLSKLVFSAVVVNAMPFDRKDNPRQSLAVCRQLLDAPGHILILFPEGTRTTDGAIGRFKPGIGFLTAGTPIPVVPCYLHGAHRAWPKGKWLPRPRKLRLIIGTPLQFPELAPEKEDAVKIAERLREAVVELGSRAIPA
jgi:1-acyl-sn-glycerol-3-phosphate acyltransferase